MQKKHQKTHCSPFLGFLGHSKTPGKWSKKRFDPRFSDDLTQDFLTKMSFANRLSSNKCTVSTVYPKPKSGPSGGPVGFSFNARQTKNGFEYPFWLHFSTRYHSFSSPWATRPNGSRQPSKRFASTPTFNDKKIGSDMFYCKQKNIEPTTKPNKFELISVNFHTRNQFLWIHGQSEMG